MSNRLTPEDLYRIVLISDPRITSDGSRGFFVETRLREKEYYSSILMVKEGKVERITGEKGGTCPTPSSDGGSLAYTLRDKEKKETKIMLLDLDTLKDVDLARFKGGISKIVWDPHGRFLLFEGIMAPEKDYMERDFLDINRLPPYFNNVGWMFDRYYGIWRVELPSGRIKRISPENADSTHPTISLDGKYVAYAIVRNDLTPYYSDIIIQDLTTGERKEIVKKMVVSDLSWGPTGLIAIRGHFRERGGSTHHRIYISDESGSLQCATCNINYNTLNSVNSDVRGPRCKGDLEWDKEGSVYFPLHYKGAVHIYRAKTPSAVPEPVYTPADRVVDEFSVAYNGRIMMTMMSPTMPKDAFTLVRGSEPERITESNRWIKDYGLEEPVKYSVMSNNHEIDYWILHSTEKDCERCEPWILYIHGGPKTSFGYGFMFEFHVLSNAGYAVVYGNPHGSDGYEEEFADIRGRYGTVDYQDLIAIAKDAVRRESSLSDKLVGVAGGSYGGWMTNYIITKTDLFKTAITMRSCSNWSSFMGASDIGYFFAEDQLGAQPWESPEVYIEKSPLFNADKIRTPTLIIHSTEDYRCPQDQAIALYSTLRLKNVKTRLALFPKETHDLMRSGTPRRRIARLKVILEWLKDTLSR